MIFGLKSELNENYLDSLVSLNNYNKNNKAIVVSKCKLAPNKYSIIIDKQFDLSFEISSIENTKARPTKLNDQNNGGYRFKVANSGEIITKKI